MRDNRTRNADGSCCSGYTTGTHPDAARRRMSRSSRSRALSRSSFRIRSVSVIAAASDSSVLPARGFDEKRATQFFRVLGLIPSSAATEFSDAPSVDSYKATASRLNC